MDLLRHCEVCLSNVEPEQTSMHALLGATGALACDHTLSNSKQTDGMFTC